MTTTTAAARPKRLVAATALLASFGAVGLFAPIGTIALAVLLIGGLTSGTFGSSGQVALAWGAFALPATPLICLVAVIAAAGLYRGRRWGLMLGRVIGALLVAGALYRIVTWADQSEAFDGPARIAVSLIGHHVFLAPPVDVELLPGGIGVATILTVSIGLLVLAGLAGSAPSVIRPDPVAGEPGAEPGEAVPRSPAPRRLGIATAVLVVLAIDALIPLAVLLGALVFPWRVGGGLMTASHGSGGSGSSVVTGAMLVMLGLPSITAMTLALLGARAIHRRSPAAPYLGPAAAAVAALWAAPWVLILATVVQQNVAPDVTVDGSVALFLVLAAIVLPISSFLLVTWAAVSARSSFPLPTAGRVITLPRRSRVGAAGVVAATALALVILLPGPDPDVPEACIDDCPTEVFETAWFGESEYLIHSAVAVLDPVAIGTLDDWTADLPIADPTVYGIVGVDPEVAVIVRSAEPVDDDGRRLDHYFLVSTDFYASEDLPITLEACDAVVFQGSGLGGLCGPPDWILADGREYIGTTAFDVSPTELTPTSLVADGDFRWARSEAARAIHAIRGVDPAVAVAIVFSDQAVVYIANLEVKGELPSSLCAYVAQRLIEAGETPEECRG